MIHRNQPLSSQQHARANVRGSVRNQVVNKKFIVKEMAMLKQETVLMHYIFTSPVLWKFLTRSDRSCASWLITYHHVLQWEDGMVPYNETPDYDDCI